MSLTGEDIREAVDVLLDEYNIEFQVEASSVTSRPGWEDDSIHFTIRWTPANGVEQCHPFSVGSAWDSVPTATDVVHCLIFDASTVSDGQSFREWCDDFGFEGMHPADALKMYNGCLEMSKLTDVVFGTDELRYALEVLVADY